MSLALSLWPLIHSMACHSAVTIPTRRSSCSDRICCNYTLFVLCSQFRKFSDGVTCLVAQSCLSVAVLVFAHNLSIVCSSWYVVRHTHITSEASASHLHCHISLFCFQKVFSRHDLPNQYSHSHFPSLLLAFIDDSHASLVFSQTWRLITLWVAVRTHCGSLSFHF